MDMRKWLVAGVGVALLAGCVTAAPKQTAPQGITFETGKSRRAVMDVIVDVGTDDGFTVGSISQKGGRIVFKPRKMLDGVLSKKTSDSTWAIQTKGSTFNRLIQFSADVSEDGVVKLKTLVMVSGLDGPVDNEKSQKLARYYEQRILRVLRTPRPKLLLHTPYPFA